MSVEFRQRRSCAPAATCSSAEGELALPSQHSNSGVYASVSWCAAPAGPRRRSRRAKQPAACFELAQAEPGSGRLTCGQLLVSRPVAALAVLPRPLVLFAAGAVSGAIGALGPSVSRLTSPAACACVATYTFTGCQVASCAALCKAGNCDARLRPKRVPACAPQASL